jgi:hypothetical protein
MKTIKYYKKLLLKDYLEAILTNEEFERFNTLSSKDQLNFLDNHENHSFDHTEIIDENVDWEIIK